MLKPLSKGACALAVATTFAASTAQAAEHVVLIVEGGFFPAVTYVDPGDTILFTNATDTSQEVYGPEESWMSGSIPVEGTYNLAIEASTAETYAGVGSDGVEINGEISYEDAPLAD